MDELDRLKDNLRFYRVAILKMDQEALSEQLKCARSSISRYEKGHAVPPLDYLIAFANLSKQSLDTLVGREVKMMSIDGLTDEQHIKLETEVSRYRTENEK